jgi:N-acetylneuraminic acid mutarotase
LWEWDQATDAWTQKADLPGNGRASAVGFSVGNKGYIGTGYNNHTSFNSKKDFWEWDQSTNVWIQKANLAGVGRQSAVGVSIGNKGYIATGFGGNAGGYLQDLWEYDPNLK